MRLHKRGAVESIKYGVSAAKDLVLLDPFKDQNGDLLSNEKDILNRWREYFKDLSNSTIVNS